jgi:hypothetical protein
MIDISSVDTFYD